jgi:hypothetical protein
MRYEISLEDFAKETALLDQYQVDSLRDELRVTTIDELSSKMCSTPDFADFLGMSGSEYSALERGIEQKWKEMRK